MVSKSAPEPAGLELKRKFVMPLAPWTLADWITAGTVKDPDGKDGQVKFPMVPVAVVLIEEVSSMTVGLTLEAVPVQFCVVLHTPDLPGLAQFGFAIASGPR